MIRDRRYVEYEVQSEFDKRLESAARRVGWPQVSGSVSQWLSISVAQCVRSFDLRILVTPVYAIYD